MTPNVELNLIIILIFFLLRESLLQENYEAGEFSVENCSNKNSNCLNLKTFDGAVLKSIYDSAKPLVHCKTTGALRIESMTCFGPTGSLDCEKPLPIGTLVSFTCPPFYKTSTTTSMCKSDGNWTVPIKCNPECGRSSPAAIPLIMHGRTVIQGQWPWASSLYHRINGKWMFSCGGTLIADNAVITAAHCTWSIKKEDMLVALGHLPISLPQKNDQSQVFHVKRVFILPVFRDSTNYYNSDIAILILESPAELSDKILPACLPDSNTNASVTPFTSGIVAGWGLVENMKPPLSIQYMKVPIIDTVRCLKYIPRQFTKFIAISSFCAGYINGTGACNGDSGNGLLTLMNDQWVLQGVVSISPRRGSSSFCHPRNYSLYTKVKLYVEWIMKVLAFEDNKTLQEKGENF